MAATSRQTTPGSPALYLVLGSVGGVAYAIVNGVMDSLVRRGELGGALALLHTLVDHVVPVLFGLLLGLAVHHGKLRAALAEAERRRAEALGERLSKTERDQAVWVVAAATLHDLKNPLHALGLLLEELDGAQDDRDERASLIARARAQIDRALVPLDALRAIARDIRPSQGAVPLAPVLEDLVHDIEPLASQAKIDVALEAAGAPVVRGDRARLKIVLENLVGNALESLRERGGRGRLRIAVEASEGQAVVRVQDDGPGVSDAAREALFAPLSTTRAQGLGLGLSIAQALARSMGGEVQFVEEPPWSTTFRLALPLAA